MLIESAFFKLSDYFQSIESPRELYESQVSFIFAVAIFQELQSRGFPFLLPYIQVNRPYPQQKQNRKVDVYLKIPKSKLPAEILHRWANSGVCEENWIEVKFFGGAERKGITSTEPKTQNLGKLLEALLRLKFYVREGGKYLLLVFNRKPEYYLPFSDRKYLPTLLKPGRDSVKIDFMEKQKTVVKFISEDLKKLVIEKKEIEFDLQKYSIEPLVVKGLIIPSDSGVLRKSKWGGAPVGEPTYYFHLLRILETYEKR
jgi:hypothetical protein